MRRRRRSPHRDLSINDGCCQPPMYRRSLCRSHSGPNLAAVDRLKWSIRSDCAGWYAIDTGRREITIFGLARASHLRSNAVAARSHRPDARGSDIGSRARDRVAWPSSAGDASLVLGDSRHDAAGPARRAVSCAGCRMLVERHRGASASVGMDQPRRSNPRRRTCVYDWERDGTPRPVAPARGRQPDRSVRPGEPRSVDARRPDGRRRLRPRHW